MWNNKEKKVVRKDFTVVSFELTSEDDQELLQRHVSTVYSERLLGVLGMEKAESSREYIIDLFYNNSQ